MTKKPIIYGEDLSAKVRELSEMFVLREYTKEEALKTVKEIQDLALTLENSLNVHGGNIPEEKKNK